MVMKKPDYDKAFREVWDALKNGDSVYVYP